jgi:hypothetical protein
MLLIGIYNSVINQAVNSNYIFAFISGLVMPILMWAAFLSGWGYAVRQAIISHYSDENEKEKLFHTFNVFSKMLKGIGDYFLSFVGVFFIIIVFMLIVVTIASLIGKSFIGEININVEELKNVLTLGNAAISEYVHKLPIETIKNLFLWIQVLFFSMTVVWFSCFFLTAAVLKNSKNPFKAFLIQSKFIWTNFLSTAVFFLIINILQVIVVLLAFLFTSNFILSFVYLFLEFYFMVYSIVTVFLFYEKYETKSICNSGSNSIRKD